MKDKNNKIKNNSISDLYCMPNQMNVTVPVLNLYSRPDLSSPLASQALYGWEVNVLEKFHDFQQIETYDGYQGWVECKDLSPVLRQHPSNGKKVKLIYNAVPLYINPSVKSKLLWILPFEVELPVLNEPREEEGRWIKVSLIDGNSAWIQRGHVKFNSKELSLSEMLQFSKQFLGVPYIWGGISSFGFDCSGFMQMLWRQKNIFLPRDAKDQFHFSLCRHLAWEDIIPGDLIFYGISKTEIQHVGLYLGEEDIIHASVKPIPLVQVSHLKDESFKRFSYRFAKRLVVPINLNRLLA